jgi:hypothetical protein
MNNGLCPGCGKSFARTSVRQIFCAPLCKSTYNNTLKPEHFVTHEWVEYKQLRKFHQTNPMWLSEFAIARYKQLERKRTEVQ